MTGTQALLADYVRNGSERAFRELVNSYINFVYSTALRVLGGNRQLAEDVSQNVFIDLARKAAMLPADVSLGGWLHRHTRFLAHKALRRELRLNARELRAIELRLIDDYTEENLGEVAAVLDEAINDLATEDRTAILLRFFEQLDFQSVGKALGSSEDAARMRVSRALEKLGSLLKRRGITSSVSALGFLLETKAVSAAPAGLATSVSKVALACAARGWTSFAVIKEACFTRLNIGIVSASVVIGLATLLIATRQPAATAGFAVSQGDPDESFDTTQEEPGLQTTVKADSRPAQPIEPISESPAHPKAGNVVAGGTGARQVSPSPIRPATTPVPTPAPQSPAQSAFAASPRPTQMPGMTPSLSQSRSTSLGRPAGSTQIRNGTVRSSLPPPPAQLMASPWQTMATVSGPRPSTSSTVLSQPASNLKTGVQQPVDASPQNVMLSQNKNVAGPPVRQMTAFTPAGSKSSPRLNDRSSGKGSRVP